MKAIKPYISWLADFIIEKYAYINANLDEFTWEGADVHPFDDAGSTLAGIFLRQHENGLEEKRQTAEKVPVGGVRDNVTRGENISTCRMTKAVVHICPYHTDKCSE